MAVDWRELGEVPDSEDEDFLDSQPTGSQPSSSARFQVEIPANSPSKTTVNDIWDIPSSQEDVRPPQTAPLQRLRSRSAASPTPQPIPSEPSSSPLSSLRSSQDLPSIDHFLTNHSPSQISTASSATPRANSPRNDHILSSPPVSDDEAIYLGSAEPRPTAAVSTQVPLQSQILGYDAEEQEEARRAVVRYERSLRSRKPEQMRPYFTERTRFNNEWRQHGLRPVRFANEERDARPQRQNSNERDFEPGSQDSSAQQPTDDSLQNPSSGVIEGLLIPESSSPLRSSPLNTRTAPSSQLGQLADTDSTSLDGDELPTLEDLMRHPTRFTPKQAKRKLSSKVTAPGKRRRTPNPPPEGEVHQPPPAFIVPPGSSDPLDLPDEQAPDSRAAAAVSPSPRRNIGWRARHLVPESSPSIQETAAALPPPVVIDSDSGEQTERPTQTEDTADSGSSSDSGSEIVHRNSRRIRGVLPASWLRLDQLPSRDQVQKRINHRHLGRSPEREGRRGVAQRRQADPTLNSDRLLFEDSKDDGDEAPRATRVEPTTDEVFHSQTRLTLEPTHNDFAMDFPSSDDDASVVEEDHIDPMVSGRKRQTKIADAFQRSTKRPKVAATKPPSTNPTRTQQKITHALSGNSNTLVPGRPRKQATKTRKRQGPGAPRRQHRAPQLSVLDVIEPDAPKFLKIAARTARGRRDQGRSAPTRKSIQLATRTDHIDAASVLQDWTNGSIQQRASVTSARKTRQAKPRANPLVERSANESRPAATRDFRTPTNAPRKLGRILSKGNASRKTPAARSGNANRPSPRPRNEGQDFQRSARPAQLEMDHGEMTPASFHAGKRLLDRLYRTKSRTSTIATSVLSTNDADHGARHPPSLRRSASLSTERSAPRTPRRLKRPPRPPKKSKPRRVDIEAPQYTHANDPLPVDHGPSPAPAAPELSHRKSTGAQLLGLSQYGTHYTHHFEIFPLETGVYFHDSTLMGSGVVERVLCEDPCPGVNGPHRPRASLALGELTLRWGPWSAQVSSELGVIFDYIADQLERDSQTGSTPNAPSPVAAVDHVLSYIKGSLTLDEQPHCRAFVCRFIEVIQTFNSRITSSAYANTNTPPSDDFLGVYDRIMLATFRTLKICRGDQAMVGEQLQMEELLKSVAGVLMKALSSLGLHDIRKMYGELRNARVREWGLRSGASGIHSWVLALRVLESAAIPRASFWDLVQQKFFPSGFDSSINAQEHERVWEDVFTLLPLVEFNDMGVLLCGRRYRCVTDGWSLIQKLLKTIFQLYRDNSRQPPNFNNYCRAIVARCHYLVQQWGWRRCSGIVGLIFDFFGSQNLGHLRNEEAYSSPKFLEDLAKGPSLEVQSDDRCFHIFLKLVALGICRLKEDGSTKDIRNLVARTVPNHNRQHLKEQTIHERDLAALRNHHDLLCTLYWAAPPDLRPSVGLLERLVVPASSHKEACLINLRAWNQLARYIVASGQAPTCFAPFNQWRNSFFQQVMQQFDSVSSDIQQQFLGLSKDVTKSINQDMINAMTTLNKTAIMDVLYFSVSASLDAMKHAPDLEAATFALSTTQLQQVFRHFSAVPPELDWGILRAASSTLDAFLSQVDRFKEDEESQQSESQILNSAQADDALMVLHQDLAGAYFSMARRVLSSRSAKDMTATAAVDRAACIEQAVVLAARLGARFVSAGVMRLSDMFKPGRHRLYADAPHLMSLEERRHLTLFVATLLKYGVDDMDGDVGFSLQELWMSSIVKPRASLAFENQLGEQLAQQGKSYVPETMVGLATSPDYSMNRDLFEFAMSAMRRTARDAGPNLKKILTAEFSKTLKTVMEQIKNDLRTISSQDAVEHSNFVSFIRDIIALIRAHGSDICAVDEFFYQISKEYSPSMQDPTLQVAGMVSYGLRLAEGDRRVAHQLFFFLFNNFKLAMMNDKMDEEVRMLDKGLRNQGILHFVLSNMVPAMIRASGVEVASCLLVDIYAEAFYLYLEDDEAPPELDEDSIGPLTLTLSAMVDALIGLSGKENLANEEVHLVRQMMGFMNIFWPSIYVLHLSGVSSAAWDEVKSLLRDYRSFASWAQTYIESWLEIPDETDAGQRMLFRGLQRVSAERRRVEPLAVSFADNIINDVRRNWIVSEGRLSIQAPGKAQGTQSTRGIERRTVDRGDVLMDLLERTRIWNGWWERTFDSAKHAVTVSVPIF